MSEEEAKKVKFVPFSTTVSPGFWYQLVNKKLDVYKLNDSVQEITGFYSNTDISGLACRHSVEYNSFEASGKAPPLCLATHGNLYNKNTLQEFKEVDKKQLLESQALLIWKNIETGEAIQDPSLLVRFCLLTFADLKNYHFYYWFAYPTFLHSSDNIRVIKSCLLVEQETSESVKIIGNAINEDRRIKRGFYFISFSRDDGKVNCHELTEFDNVTKSKNELWFVCLDPSTEREHPGWPLRNFLILINMHWAKILHGDVKVLCLRDQAQNGIRSISNSLWMHLKMDVNSPMKIQTLKPIGWERNRNNKLTPRFVNLGESMDPIKLAESAVDLNLKLMRWRLMPSINLEKISNSRCLLLGAGTLGCNVARCLLGWGVKKITLLDNGHVSFSNPVRQTLYEFSDCSPAGGRPKATAAAEKLKKIFPGVEASGVELTIPMPGHPVNTNKKTLDRATQDIVTLIDLVENHDAVFLLMDSRESRWLPTLISAEKRKLVINAALGFDSYLVMRHGVDSCSEDGAADSKPKLGCYFCNDVVAPGNSTRDRTLDQQCTVSRPGISMIASAVAVELFVAVTQHSMETLHLPNEIDDEETEASDDSPLGKIPHQIRGFLSQYLTLLPTTYSFTKCTACSDTVLEKYRSDKINFLLNVFNSPSQYLEDVTGLTQLHQETALAEDEILEFSDSESI